MQEFNIEEILNGSSAELNMEVKIPAGKDKDKVLGVYREFLEKATFEEVQLLLHLCNDSLTKSMALGMAKNKYGHKLI